MFRKPRYFWTENSFLMQGQRRRPKNTKMREGGNASALRKQKAGKCYHVAYHDWQEHFMCLYLTNQLLPRHKPFLTPLWMTVCWFCSFMFTFINSWVCSSKKKFNAKMLKMDLKRIRKQRKNVSERKIRLIYSGICRICQRICGG